jgi:ribose transport system permease protein
MNNLYRLFTQQKAIVAIAVILLVMVAAGGDVSRIFFSSYNLLDMLNSSTILVILGLGVTLTVIAGGCDLSIGGILVVSGILSIQLQNFMPMPLALVLAVLFGTLVGFFNGFLVVQQKTEPFIITLGVGLLLTGVAQQLSDAHPVPANNPDFMNISNGYQFGDGQFTEGHFPGIPNLVIIMLICFVFFAWLIRYTSFGRNLYAIGGDYDVARYSGINVVANKWMTLVISGTMAALGGVLLSSKLNTGSAIYGDFTALVVNCGVVVGGTSFAGGVGGIWQSVLGLLLFGLLDNAMNVLNIPSWYQMMLKGTVIVAILWMDSYTQKRKRELV